MPSTATTTILGSDEGDTSKAVAEEGEEGEKEDGEGEEGLFVRSRARLGSCLVSSVEPTMMINGDTWRNDTVNVEGVVMMADRSFPYW